MKRIPTMERQRLVIALAQRAMTFADLCRHLGIGKAALSHLLEGASPWKPLRRRIDLFLGEPVLTPDFEFSHHNKVQTLIGIDPILCKTGDLCKLAESRGISTHRKSREALVTALVGSFARERRGKEAE